MELQPQLGLRSNRHLDGSTDNPADTAADGIYSPRLLSKWFYEVRIWLELWAWYVRQRGCLHLILSPKKGKDNNYALHYRCNSAHIVARRVTNFLHHGWFDSRAAGNRDHRHLG